MEFWIADLLQGLLAELLLTFAHGRWNCRRLFADFRPAEVTKGRRDPNLHQICKTHCVLQVFCGLSGSGLWRAKTHCILQTFCRCFADFRPARAAQGRRDPNLQKKLKNTLRFADFTLTEHNPLSRLCFLPSAKHLSAKNLQYFVNPPPRPNPQKLQKLCENSHFAPYYLPKADCHKTRGLSLRPHNLNA